MKAEFIKKLDGWKGDARFYKVDPPMEYGEKKTTSYVIVSAVVALSSGPETYIFPAQADGIPLGYGELEGSFRGGLDHEEALRGAGYEVK